MKRLQEFWNGVCAEITQWTPVEWLAIALVLVVVGGTVWGK